MIKIFLPIIFLIANSICKDEEEATEKLKWKDDDGLEVCFLWLWHFQPKKKC